MGALSVEEDGGRNWPKGPSHMRVVASVVTGAKNARRRRCAFNPEQWVFGESARLPADLVGGARHGAAHE
eukprot:3312284-Pyramimonas_sp.AAC.1